MGMRSAALRWIGLALLAAVLALAFVGYLQPGFIVDLANRFVMCF
ncbi:MAG: hypothetical protein JWP36_2174 [Paucimonas sp.]|jgi:hypothetical protein|nr:hypothetical protein [Paucimonas sp.]